MCTGLEVMAIGAALAGGGTYLNSQAIGRKEEARDKAAMAGLKRQDAFTKEQGDVYQDALGDIDARMSAENRSQVADESTDKINANVGDREISFQNAAVDGPKVLKSRTADNKATGDAYLDTLADARGRLNSWGSTQQDLGRDMFKRSWDTDRIGADALADAQIAQMEAQYAYDSTGNKTALAGNLGTQIGAMLLTQGAFNAGMAGLSKGATAGAGTAAGGTGAGTAAGIAPNVGAPMATPTYDPYGTLRVIA